MLEYANVSMFVFTVIAGLLVLFIKATRKDKSKTSLNLLYILFIVILLLAIYDTYSKYNNALENIENFKNKTHVLKCHNKGGLYSSSNTYRVSLKDGWSLDKNYFVKDSLMIRADTCEKI